jgi:hypothetical protein
MPDISLHLDDWQEEALGELARSRGIALEAMASSLLNERLVERIHCAFDDLLSGEPILPSESLIGEDIRRGVASPETIEERLKRLFAD